MTPLNQELRPRQSRPRDEPGKESTLNRYNNPPTIARRRRSIRLQGYDYAQAGVYFFTIVTQARACLFGEVNHREMQLNDAGTMIRQVWLALPERFPESLWTNSS